MCVNEFLVHVTFVCVGSLRDSVIIGVRVLFVHKYLQINKRFVIKVVCCMQCCFLARYRLYHLTLYYAEEVFLYSKWS